MTLTRIASLYRVHFKMLFLTPELHQRCGVGDDDRRKSRHSPVAQQRDCDETERLASPGT